MKYRPTRFYRSIEPGKKFTHLSVRLLDKEILIRNDTGGFRHPRVPLAAWNERRVEHLSGEASRPERLLGEHRGAIQSQFPKR